MWIKEAAAHLTLHAFHQPCTPGQFEEQASLQRLQDQTSRPKLETKLEEDETCSHIYECHWTLSLLSGAFTSIRLIKPIQFIPVADIIVV